MAFKILKDALTHEGVGGKTSSDYGRMEVLRPPPDPSEEKAEAMLRAVKSIPANKLPSELSRVASALLESDLSSPYKRRVAEAIIQRVNAGGSKQMKKFEQKAWFAEVEKLMRWDT